LHFAQNTAITLLDISGNRMGAVGTKALGDLLVSRVSERGC
jgi:hypothetical protein